LFIVRKRPILLQLSQIFLIKRLTVKLNTNIRRCVSVFPKIRLSLKLQSAAFRFDSNLIRHGPLKAWIFSRLSGQERFSSKNTKIVGIYKNVDVHFLDRWMSFRKKLTTLIYPFVHNRHKWIFSTCLLLRFHDFTLFSAQFIYFRPVSVLFNFDNCKLLVWKLIDWKYFFTFYYCQYFHI
jgi:hypothetical protein